MTTSADKLFALINATASPTIPFSAQNVSMVDLTEDLGVNHNTRVSLRPLPNAPVDIRQDAFIYYRRIDLAVMDGFTFTRDQASSPQAVLDALNAHFGSWLELEDLAPFTVPADTGSDAVVHLSAKADNLAWIGALNLSVQTSAAPHSHVVFSVDQESTVSEDQIIPIYKFEIVPISDERIKFDISLADGTAIKDLDYYNFTGVDHFDLAPGTNAVTQTLLLASPQVSRPARTILLNVTNKENVVMNDQYVVHLPELIVNLPTLSMEQQTMEDGDGDQVIPVVFSIPEPYVRNVHVSLVLGGEGDTAIAGTDFVSQDAGIDFDLPPGITTFRILIHRQFQQVDRPACTVSLNVVGSNNVLLAYSFPVTIPAISVATPQVNIGDGEFSPLNEVEVQDASFEPILPG